MENEVVKLELPDDREMAALLLMHAEAHLGLAAYGGLVPSCDMKIQYEVFYKGQKFESLWRAKDAYDKEINLIEHGMVTLWRRNNLFYPDGSPRVPGMELCESPIEEMFWDVLHDFDGFVPQVEVGPFRLDFANAAKRIAIELDGHDFHKTKEQRTSDAQRDRKLTKLGWRVLRFTGSEVYQDATGCVFEVDEIMKEIK